MVTSTSPLARQPDQLDYASPSQFRFGIKQLPDVEFFTIDATLPGITATSVDFNTPFKDIPVMGDKLTYNDQKTYNFNTCYIYLYFLCIL